MGWLISDQLCVFKNYLIKGEEQRVIWTPISTARKGKHSLYFVTPGACSFPSEHRNLLEVSARHVRLRRQTPSIAGRRCFSPCV